MTVDLDRIYAAIDEVNAADPNLIDWHGAKLPRAQLQGVRATCWVGELSPDASVAVCVAARAHHLGRWIVPRTTYPDGRAGYLRWRTELKRRHAAALADLLVAQGAPASLIERATALVQRRGLGVDPETQLVEDAACLVFLETQAEALRERLGDERMDDTFPKVAAKMSEAALALARERLL